MSFQRARSDEQRQERRDTILKTASIMLTEMPVAQLSLNELSRRVSLAKSNVLRYFESREAILLELLNQELQGWVDEVGQTLESDAFVGHAREQGDHVARVLAESLADRPILCDLVSAQAAVLERNVSAEVALGHKRRIGRSVDRLVDIIRQTIPLLSQADAYHVVVVTILMTSAAWPQSQPSEAIIAAYAMDPAVAAHQSDFAEVIAQTTGVTISGLLARSIPQFNELA